MWVTRRRCVTCVTWNELWWIMHFVVPDLHRMYEYEDIRSIIYSEMWKSMIPENKFSLAFCHTSPSEYYTAQDLDLDLKSSHTIIQDNAYNYRLRCCHHFSPGPLFTKQTDILPLDLVKSRSREIGCYNGYIALKFDRHLGSTVAEVRVKFQSDWKSLNQNIAALRLHEIFR